MPQLLLPGMPEGAIRINSVVSRLAKDGQVTWFLGADNYFSHSAGDSAGQSLALATLMANGHARPCQIHQTLGSPHVRWCAGASNSTHKVPDHSICPRPCAARPC